MKVTRLFIALVAVAGLAIGQATSSFIPIARWLGFYQRVDVSQTKVWDINGSTAVFLPIEDPIEICGYLRVSDLWIVEWDPSTQTPGAGLMNLDPAADPADWLLAGQGRRIDPAMWGYSHIALQAFGTSGGRGLLQYRAMD